MTVAGQELYGEWRIRAMIPRIMPTSPVTTCFCLAFFLSLSIAAAEDIQTEDFEAGFKADRWSFSEGKEFPGASGKFERAKDAAHGGQFGGRLSFDFSGGGNYVAAVATLDKVPELAAVKLWVYNPGDNHLTFRYLDQSGQVHQKPFTAPKGQWADVTITTDDWQAHFGGPGDGKIRGGPKALAFLVENTDLKRGQLFIDDIRFVPGKAVVAETALYTAYCFAPAEGWSLRASGNAGASRLEGGKLAYDFTRGGRSLTLSRPDEPLLGKPVEIRLHLRGQAPGHALRLQIATHFMVFERNLGEISGSGEHEMVVPAPPGAGWQFFGGENDGKLHGLLRITGLVLDAGSKVDQGELEIRDIQVKAEYPSNRACILQADYRAKDNKFVAICRGLLPKASSGSLAWTLRDWDGAVLSKGAKDVSLPALTEPLELAIDAPTSTTDFVEAEFSLQVSGQKIAPATACYVSQVQARGDDKLDGASPFGMGLYLYRYPNTPEGLAEMDRAAGLAARAGVKWSREEFHWARIQGKKGQFDWSFYDKLVATAKKHGISVYGLLAYWSDWTKPYTQEGIDDYSRFAAEAVKRYRDDIRHWEVWNEPNIFFWQGSRDQYAQLLKSAAAAIKEANPQAKVLGCSTSGIDTAFIKRTLELGAPFDALTIHPYRADLYDLRFIEELRSVAGLVKPSDGQARPVWITEMGWSTQSEFPWMGQDFRANSQRRQAQMLARTYLDALASGVCANISWYDFRNDGQDPFNDEMNMGIMTRDFRPKPAYRAFATLTRLLAGKRFDAQVDMGKDVVAFRFIGGQGGPVLAIWNPSGELDASLPSSKSATLVNLMGASRKLDPQDGKLTLRAPVGQPVFAVTE